MRQTGQTGQLAAHIRETTPSDAPLAWNFTPPRAIVFLHRVVAALIGTIGIILFFGAVLGAVVLTDACRTGS